MVRHLRHAVRLLLKTKGWTAVVLASLALGIGANTALFNAVNGLLIKTLPVKDPDRLVRLRWVGENDMARNFSGYGYVADTAAGERVSASFSYPMFEALRAANGTLEDLIVAAPRGRLNLMIEGRAETGTGLVVSGNYFDVLGIPAVVGRVITPDDDRVEASPVVVISHRFWSQGFGRDPDVVGTVIRVSETPMTIVGILPPTYTGIQRPAGEAADIHLPLAFGRHPGEEDRLSDATYWWLLVMGRLKAGVTPAQVQGNLDGVFRTSARSGMDTYLAGATAEERARSGNRDRSDVPRLLVDSGKQGVYDPSPSSSRQALILGVVVLLVLLIVCANVAVLLLSWATARQKEIAVRLSVGATRGRLVGQLVTESLVLSVLGGGLGILIALGVRPLLPFGESTPFDWRVFGFVVVLSLGAGLTFSLVPALRSTRLDLAGTLKEQNRSVARPRTPLGKALLVVQVAVSLVLLVGAGLFLKTLSNLRDVDVGFKPDNLLLARLDPSRSGYDSEQAVSVYERITEKLQVIPGVRAVSLSRFAFLNGSTWVSTLHVEGQDRVDGFNSHMMTVAPNFFEAMGIPLLAGHTFEAQDGRDAPPVVVINSTAARELFGSDNPLGRRVGFSPEERSEFQVIGVVQDVKYNSVRDVAPPTTYRSTVQSPLSNATFVIRTAGPPSALTAAVHDAVQQVDPRLPLMDVRTQSAAIEQRLSEERLFALAYTSFGGLAILLAAIGLFGLASYSVGQRTNEIGIRMALGADASGVTRMVLGESLILVAVGVVAGIVGVLLAGRLVASLLFDLAPTDPLTIVQSVVVLVMVSALAGYLPARRAARVDPVAALQEQ